MKNLLYIGNQLSQSDKTVTTIDTLSKLLSDEGFSIVTTSGKKNKFLRLLDMLYQILKHRNWANYILIDTYSTQNFYYAYLCSQLCRFFKLKYIPILHGGNLQNRLKNSQFMSKAIFNNAFKNIAPSEFLKLQFQEYGYGNLEVIPNSIEPENYPFKERDFSKPKLLWVRSFSKIYNPLLAINVLKILKDDNIQATLCMVGPDKDGSLNEAKIYASDCGVDVRFTGKLSKEDWIKISEDFNIFINTTDFDNMPVSVIEGMALGLPIISTNVGGLPFLIENEKEGLLIEPNDAFLFVEKIKQIIENPEMGNNLAANGRIKIEQFDWEIIKNQWIKLLI
ncbi:glycosyltransferase family 4 protein [Algibacter aquimarinus]|uniref:Glycosyl transferase family 1 domain-containing protein n=1 Tax=Algibacter aquimarinus TaxID=1136748 RepID=A0ABP9HR14_9FLAO